MAIDIAAELAGALRAARDDITAIVREAVRAELVTTQGRDPDELLDAERAAKLLGLSVGALRRAAARGTAPVAPVRLGRRLRWRRGDVVRLVTERSE